MSTDEMKTSCRVHAKTIGALVSAAALAMLAGCGDGDGGKPSGGTGYLLSSVVIDTDGNRTTYVQTLADLEGPFDNRGAVELPGNGVVMSDGKSVYVGQTEEPVWVRYAVGKDGKLAEAGRLNLQNLGVGRIDYGNTLVDAETAVSVFSVPPVAVVWNPQTMELRGEIALPHLTRAGYETEVWTTVAHGGKVYIPGRFADWEGGRIFAGVSMTIVDPKTLQILAVAEDDRCASGGRVVFDAAGYAYVMGDGRNYSIQMFANAAGQGEVAPANCLLRIPPGGTDFEAGYYHKIPSLTGGRTSITELEAPADAGGVAFTKMFYPERLASGQPPVDFDFWSEQAHKLWRIKLADPPVAEEVTDIPFSAIGFTGSALGGHLFSGESVDGGATSDVYETDPATNRAVLRFRMDGYFNGLYELK
jgi:hypothetical protein